MAIAIFSGLGNTLSWAVVALYLLLAIGFGYVLFVEPEVKLAV